MSASRGRDHPNTAKTDHAAHRTRSGVIDDDGLVHAHRPAPLAPILALSFLATFGTAVLWNGLAFIAKEAYGFD